MHVVNEWLTLVGFDPKKAASCGVLQDSMRNGSLLCVLLTQVLKCTSFPFFKTPRTLTEMRENISKAVEKLGELPREQIPRTVAVVPSKLDQELRAPSIALSELSDISPLPTADPTKTTGPSSSGHVIEPSPTKSPTAQTYLTSTLPREPVEEILSWLKRLDINLKNASALQDPSATLREFQSGVLLCCIVEKVEFMRSIPGITRPSGKQPLSKASSLHNITKALAILQQKKTMPLHLLRRAAGIYAGDRGVILQLLLQIRKAYGHHHAPRRRHRHQQQQQQQQQSHSSAA
ncbi:uncharacterized protein IUM83_08231 [Phytophthora cinnamomi]|uniref:uncharacterized protein n=1 Tax=Phytophthora cinnamomi TaxID=4785 RepID=UPI00355A6641|nr:hypothetical protein IUM83_08231 [Phytophthora cinnamomi]